MEAWQKYIDFVAKPMAEVERVSEAVRAIQQYHQPSLFDVEIEPVDEQVVHNETPS